MVVANVVGYPGFVLMVQLMSNPEIEELREVKGRAYLC